MNWWILLSLRVVAQDSVPEVGSFARYRAALRDSLLSIVPVDGAEFIPNQRFDVSVEFHALGFDPPSMENLEITINGDTAEKALGKPLEAVETWNFTYAKTLKALDQKDYQRGCIPCNYPLRQIAKTGKIHSQNFCRWA